MNDTRDAYSSPTVRVIAALMVIVPLALLVAGTYWVGTWTGGVAGGVGSVALEAAVLGVVYVRRRGRL
jgi:hypothetical protein